MKKTIKRTIIVILIICIAASSCYIVLNYEQLTPTINSLFGITTTETVSSRTEIIQEETTKPKKNNSQKKKKKATKAVIYTYVLNTNTRRFHCEDCRYVDTIAEHNKEIVQGDKNIRETIIERGFKPCQVCLP